VNVTLTPVVLGHLHRVAALLHGPDTPLGLEGRGHTHRLVNATPGPSHPQTAGPFNGGNGTAALTFGNCSRCIHGFFGGI